MKILYALIGSAWVAFAVAQSPTNLYEQQIWQAYSKLQPEANFELDLAGTESDANLTTKFSSSLFFTTVVDSRTGQATGAKIELDDYDTSGQKPVLVRRFVGDGETLWSYDLVNRRYSATFYSYYGARQPQNYPGSDAPRLLAQLYSVTRGPSSYLARLIREINPGSIALVPKYETWAPGETPGQPPTTPPTQDPLVASRFYSNVGSMQWVLYGPYTRSPNRSVAFRLDDRNGNANNPDWRLTSIYFAQRLGNRATDWSITVTDPIAIQPAYLYKPYSASFTQGWQPMSSPRPYSG